MPKQVLPTPNAAAPGGAYSPAVEAGGLVFVAGQVGVDPATGQRVEGDVAAQTEQTLENISTILGDVGLAWSDVAKSTIFLADIGDFATVNQIYARYAGSEPPARSTIQVGALPAGFLVEIEVVAAR
jgi:2-iminobutanoate/2-iminopropanoate deaminase